MTRAICRLVMVVGLLASVTAVTAGDEQYTVVLKDGSYVRASERPVIEGDIALIRLENGLLAHMEPGRIDWKRSDQVSQQMEVLFDEDKQKVPQKVPKPVKNIDGTITMTGDAKENTGEEAPPPKGPDALSGDIQAQIENVDSIIKNLRYEKQQLEQEIENKKYNLDDVKALREQITEIERKIRLAQDVRAEAVKSLKTGP